MSVRLVEKNGSLEIYVPLCAKCKAPMRIYHYFMRELTPHANESYIETEGQKLSQVYSFEFMCPLHRDKKDMYYLDTPGLILVNHYGPSQFKIIVESEPNAKVNQKIFRGDDVKKVR